MPSLPLTLRLALVLCFVPLAAHLPELLGVVDTSPWHWMFDPVMHPRSGLLPGAPFIDGNAGATTMALGGLAANDWLQGRLPWWNPYTGVGLPLASEMQPAAFFLPFVLLLHFKAGVLYLKIAVQILAGFTMLGLLRQMKLSGWPALLGAILFQLDGTFAWFADTPICPLPFLPMLIWGLERALEAAMGRRAGGEGLIALSIAGSVVAGFPETAFVDGVLCLVWAFVRLAQLHRPEKPGFAKKVITGGLLGLALCSPVLVPFLNDLRVSTLGDHAGGVMTNHLRPEFAVTLLLPYVFGPLYANPFLMSALWFNAGGYFGITAAFLAVAALVKRPDKRAIRILLATWIVIGLCAACHLPVVSWLLRHAPGLNEVQFSRYGMPSIEFAVCVLAAIALQDVLAIRAPRRMLWHVGAFLALAAFVCAPSLVTSSAYFQHGFSGDRFIAVSLGWGGVGLAALVAIWTWSPNSRLAAMVTGLATAEALSLFLIPTLSGSTIPDVGTGVTAFLEAHQKLSRSISTDPTLFANEGAMLRLGMVQYDYIPNATLWVDYVKAHLDPRATAPSWPFFMTSEDRALNAKEHYHDLEKIGVRYVVSPTAAPLFPPSGEAGEPHRVFQTEGSDIYELPDARPYADTSGATCDLDVSDREHMIANCDASATLTRRELFYPGWRVSVNGRVVPMMQQDDIFQGVPLDAGRSTIVWWYRPPFVRLIAAIFLIACAALATLMIRAGAARYRLRLAGRRKLGLAPA